VPINRSRLKNDSMRIATRSLCRNDSRDELISRGVHLLKCTDNYRLQLIAIALTNRSISHEIGLDFGWITQIGSFKCVSMYGKRGNQSLILLMACGDESIEK
jgi:hypothetical protein